jgi:DNA adenine methylase
MQPALPVRCGDLSPLRYPGSKQKLVPYLVELLHHNDVQIDTLVEPFVGGGSVFLHLLMNGLAKNVIIADKDPLIASFWSVVFSEPEALVSYVRRARVTLKSFYRYKRVLKHPGGFGQDQQARACLFLNRTSFSGLLTQKVGPLGGKNQNSPYSIDCRFIRQTLVTRIRALSKFADRVTVLNWDWRKTISYTEELLAENGSHKSLFLYLDPPFYRKASDLYPICFQEQDHRDLHGVLRDLPHNWVLSYDNADEIRELYLDGNHQDVNIEMPYSLNSHAQRREKELLITPLKLPPIKKESA